MQRPLVSVCVPMYNSEKYICQAIESVLAQTLSDFELILMDDCSTDRTLERARGYDDPRVKVSSRDVNVGMEENWSETIAQARGKYVKLLCDDDLLRPDCLARQAEILEQDEDETIALVCCDRDIVDQSGKRLMRRGFPFARGRFAGGRAIRTCVRSGTNPVGEPSAVMFRAETARQVGRFDASIPYIIDLDFWVRLLTRGDLYVIREPLCSFRVSGCSSSVEMSRSQFADMRSFFAKLRHDPVYNVGPFDQLVGTGVAYVYSRLRGLLYRRLAVGA